MLMLFILKGLWQCDSLIGWQVDLPTQFRNRLRESTLTGNESSLTAHHVMCSDKRSSFTNLFPVGQNIPDIPSGSSGIMKSVNVQNNTIIVK